MRKAFLAIAGVLAGWMATPVVAGGAYCTPEWAPENPDLGCVSQIAIAPGNDTRVNLFLLLQDRAGNNGAGLDYPTLGWDSFYGRNFLRWGFFAHAWYPQPASTNSDAMSAYGGRCQTLESGTASFTSALDSIAGLDPDAKSILTASRERLGKLCDYRPDPPAISRDGGYFVNVGANGIKDRPFAFMTYLEGAAAFYDGDWQRAKTYFGLVAATDFDQWATETSRYMIARTLLNEAIASAEDDWGWFPLKKVDHGVAKQSEAAFRAYLKTYPEGRYSASASGLIRKALWLQSDWKRLGSVYSATLAKADLNDAATVELLSEIDDKLIMRDPDGAFDDPLFVATNLLLRMRSGGHFYDQDGAQGVLTKAELEEAGTTFADNPELYSFLQANHAFYVEKDYKAVRDLLPDDARQNSYSPLAFSRQYLRGLALHALGDRNEEGFWRELIGGAQGIWQRPAIELALARVLEQNGKLDAAFTEDRLITDGRIRRILLGKSAGPELLKRQARAEGTPQGEPAFALFTVLWKQLQYGEYRGFLSDYPLTADYTLPEEYYGLWGMLDEPDPPVALFRNGKFADGFACPMLEETVSILAREPTESKGKLCLGEFYRLNGFDDFGFGNRYQSPDAPEVIGSRSFYSGKPTFRHDLYTAVMADRSASADDRAYALYRAVRCYAPSNNNTCGGEGVAKPVREGWFNQLKRNYPNSLWARELKYYW
ncbi:hypothetical protein QWY75_00780 [Pontixanthobacter aestiaquae]|uniref:Outer membrane assembly lipoprotein YfiO n=1 Tax=Pontixanthobacter aestiaquae TaxID=1509367 RepID=A0A844ZBI2_9SPHN|nr:hypothetical protein [Pontixanthobacter aestiaquae]MDN3644733.1 hypothetical protein [Pontixanthobacter aestiaquae]MXO84260.1 hypothetical protein [Pontixanthobacter aestiaquae]